MTLLVLPDGTKLFRRTWIAKDCKAVVMLVHGLGEHSGRYEEFAQFLCERGITVESFDLRGHGQSEGKRGHLGTVEEAVGDLGYWINEVSATVPRFLMGHSLGGYLVTKLMITNPVDLQGIMLSSPSLSLVRPPARWQQFMGRLAVRWMPWLTFNNQLQLTDLSRDLSEVELYRNDPLNTDQISLSTALFMIEGVKVLHWPPIPT